MAPGSGAYIPPHRRNRAAGANAEPPVSADERRHQAQPLPREAAATLRRHQQGHHLTFGDYSRRRAEQRRAESVLPNTLSRDQLEPGKHHAAWAGAFVEINGDLLAKSICPCDLNGVPCPFDEFEGGCSMVRLCGQLEKYTKHKCPDSPFRKYNMAPELPDWSEPRACGHIHWEVDISCRFVVNGQVCKLVQEKEWFCPVGHDFVSERRIARGQMARHFDAAIKCGARDLVEAHG